MNIRFSKDLKALYSLCRSYSLEKKGEIRDDSRKVKKGDLFIAIQGLQHDGHHFIASAITNGAEVIVVEDQSQIPDSFKGTAYIVGSTKKIRSVLLNQYYNWPSEKLFCVGITGTNGKTTTSYMLEKILSDGSWKTGVIGTINHHLGCQSWPSQLTTPSSIELYKRLTQFYDLDAQAVIMEVSSIGLDQNRVDGIHFNIAVFTNFSQDHLDYHKEMDQYFKAKVQLFEMVENQQSGGNGIAVFNADDESIYNYMKTKPLPFVSYGQTGSDFRYEVIKEDLNGIECSIFSHGKKYPLKLPLLGAHNASNAMSAIAASVVSGFSMEKACQSLESFQGVPGRLQQVDSSDSFYVFVDYAHTDHALDSTLKALQKVRRGKQKIITVFGCGGGRDRGKRKKMAQVVDSYSDFVVVTSDNSRDEDPKKIIQDVLKGISKKKSHVFIEEDRKEGIQKGLDLAGPRDIVLIAGKGHENKQIIKGEEIEFNDVQVARNILGVNQ